MFKIARLATAVALTASLSGAALAADKLKVGFIYVGPIGDHGFTYQHEMGRQALQKALGDQVETTFIENVPEADSERAIEQPAPATS